MKQLLFVRHAKSSWDDASLADHERPLSQRGLDDAPRMFRRLAERGVALDRIISSDAARALSTAELLAEGLAVDPSVVQSDSRLYLASPAEILAIIRGLDNVAGHVGLVGHNPGFTQIVNELVSELRLDNLPTCGIVGVSLARGSWVEAAPQHTRLTYLDYPKNRNAPFTWD